MRIHPILISELFQTRRGLVKALLFVCGSAALLRYLGMKELIWFILLPNIASGVGIGTFSEEYQKGQLKFLFSLPVKRLHIWIVKILFGIVGTLFFMVCIYAIWAVVPGEENDSSWFIWSEVLELGAGGLILLVSVISLYSFFAGHVSISLCSNQRTAGFLNQLLIYIPIVTLFLLNTRYQYVPTGLQLVAMYFIISLPCVAGGLILFLNRSPFMEQKWKWRGIGTATITAVLVSLGIFLTYADALLPPRPPDYGEKVTSFMPSPDGRKIFVTGTRRMNLSYAFILDNEGSMLRDFGTGLNQVPAIEMTWQAAAPFQTVLAQEMERTNFENGAMEFSFVAMGIGDGSRVGFPMLTDSSGMRQFIYSGWLPNSDTLVGTEIYREGQTQRTNLFLQNSRTGAVVTQKLPPGDEGSYHEIKPSGYMIITRTLPHPTLSRINLRTLEKHVVSLPADVISQTVSPDGMKIVFTRRVVTDSGVFHEIWMRGFEGQDSALVVESSVLPSGTVAMAAAGKMGTVYATFLDTGNWIHYQSSPNVLVTHEWLLNPATREKISLDELSRTLSNQPRFSPSGTKFFSLEPEMPLHSATMNNFEMAMKFKLYEIGNGSVSLLLERRLAQVNDIKWCGEDKLLYLATVDTRPGFFMGQQLRVMDLVKGIDRPLFAGNLEPAAKIEINARALLSPEDELKPTRRPLLWEIKGAAPSYIFGTVGLPFSAINALHPSVEESLARAKLVYCEIPLDEETMRLAMERYQLPAGKSLSDVVPENIMSKVRAFFDAKSVSLEIYASFGPMLIMDLIPQLEYMGRLAEAKTMDARLYERAKTAGKWGGGLVPLDSYSAYLDVLTDHEKAELLRMNVEENLLASAAGRNPSLEMARIYLSGDEAALRSRGLSCTEPENEIFKKFVRMAHSENNGHIANRIVEILKKEPGKSHFFAIQGIRIAGDDGLLRSVEASGLKLERVESEP